MEEKITTLEEYNQKIKERKTIRDEMFNLRLDLFYNKDDLEKIKLLEKNYKILKVKYTKIAFLLKQYEIENNIEVMKEGKKK